MNVNVFSLFERGNFYVGIELARVREEGDGARGGVQMWGPLHIFILDGGSTDMGGYRLESGGAGKEHPIGGERAGWCGSGEIKTC